MRRALIVPVLLLAGCGSPSLLMSGAPATLVAVGPSTFAVRQRGLEAEAIRTSAERLPSRSRTAHRARRAIEAATECGIVAAEGDVSIVTARLDCGGEDRPLPTTLVIIPVPAPGWHRWAASGLSP